MDGSTAYCPVVAHYCMAKYGACTVWQGSAPWNRGSTAASTPVGSCVYPPYNNTALVHYDNRVRGGGCWDKRSTRTDCNLDGFLSDDESGLRLLVAVLQPGMCTTGP